MKKNLLIRLSARFFLILIIISIGILLKYLSNKEYSRDQKDSINTSVIVTKKSTLKRGLI